MLQSGVYFPKSKEFTQGLYFVDSRIRLFHKVPLPKQPSPIKELDKIAESKLKKYYNLIVPTELV